MTAEIVSIRKEIIEETPQRLAVESIYYRKDELLDYAQDVYRNVGLNLYIGYAKFRQEMEDLAEQATNLWIRVPRSLELSLSIEIHGTSNRIQLARINCCHENGAASIFYIGRPKGVGWQIGKLPFVFCLDCLEGHIDFNDFFYGKWYSKTEQLPWETADEWVNRRLSELIDQLSTVIDDPT